MLHDENTGGTRSRCAWGARTSGFCWNRTHASMVRCHKRVYGGKARGIFVFDPSHSACWNRASERLMVMLRAGGDPRGQERKPDSRQNGGAKSSAGWSSRKSRNFWFCTASSSAGSAAAPLLRQARIRGAVRRVVAPGRGLCTFGLNRTRAHCRFTITETSRIVRSAGRAHTPASGAADATNCIPSLRPMGNYYWFRPVPDSAAWAGAAGSFAIRSKIGERT